MLALVAYAERWEARHATRFSTIDTVAWARVGASVGEASRSRVVCFGDSLVRFGVLPQVIEHRLGLPAYNLALPKGQAPGDYFLLRRVLRAGGRPAAVVVDIEMLADDPLDDHRRWQELLTLGETAGLAWAVGDGRFLAESALARVLPSLRTRHDVRAGVLAALGGRARDAVDALPVYLRNWKRNRGAQPMTPRDDPPGTDPRTSEIRSAGYRPGFWACHGVNAAYFVRFLQLAGSRGVPVFCVLPPIHPEVQALRDRYGRDADLTRYVRGLSRWFPNLTVVDGRHAGYPAEAVADMTHLSRPGAVAFSDALAGVIGERLERRKARAASRAGQAPPAERWVELPRWRAGAAADVEAVVAVEDVAQTVLALAKRAAEIRVERDLATARARTAACDDGRRRR
jgi:hypothetical protein